MAAVSSSWSQPEEEKMARTFNYDVNGVVLEAKMDGNLVLATGDSVRIWYFNKGFSGNRPWAGPIIEANEGNPVEITLRSGMPHTIHLHGLDVDQANDGVPATSGYVGNSGGGGGGGGGGSMGNFGRVTGYTNLGNSYTYTFTAPQAGTYQYHCHVDTVLHYEMGMHGTIIIRPANGSITEAWSGGPSFSKEYVWQLGTFDTSWHSQRVSGAGTVRYRPNLFMINGVNGTDAATDTTVAITANAGEKVLIRTNQTSYQGVLIDFSGLAFEVIAADGRPAANPQVMTSLYMTPGERYDILLTMPPAGEYTATLQYYDNKGRTVLGTLITTITSL